MVLCESLAWILCRHRSKAFKDIRKKFQRESYVELVESALPIFIAASLVSCAQTIIYSITDEGFYKVSLFGSYILLIYCCGKAIKYHVSVDEQYPYSWQIFKFIRDYRLAKIIKSTTAEHVGFALKEMAVLVTMEIVYDDFGWGAAFSVWVGMLLLFLLILLFSEYLQRHLFQISEELNYELILFDSEAFPLPAAFLLTNLLAVGLFNVGVKYVSDNSFLFSWDVESDYEPNKQSHNGYFALYCFLVSCLVSYLQARGYVASAENFIDCVDGRSSAPKLSLPAIDPSTVSRYSLPLSVDSRPSSSSIQRPSAGSQQSHRLQLSEIRMSNLSNPLGDRQSFARTTSVDSRDVPVEPPISVFYYLCCCFLVDYQLPLQCRQAILELWDNCWGYFAGVAWFVLVLDNFKASRVRFGGSKPTADLILITFSAVISTYFFVSILTSLKLRQWNTTRKHIQRVREWNLPEADRMSLASSTHSNIHSFAFPREKMSVSSVSSVQKSHVEKKEKDDRGSVNRPSDPISVLEPRHSSQGRISVGVLVSTPSALPPGVTMSRPSMSNSNKQGTSASYQNEYSSTNYLNQPIEEYEEEFSRESSVDSVENDDPAPQMSRLLFFYYWTVDYLIVIHHKQCDVMKLSFRLTVGWLWEIVIEALFILMGSNKFSDALVITVDILVTGVLLLVAFYLHLRCQDWTKDRKISRGGRRGKSKESRSSEPVKDTQIRHSIQDIAEKRQSVQDIENRQSKKDTEFVMTGNESFDSRFGAENPMHLKQKPLGSIVETDTAGIEKAALGAAGSVDDKIET